VDRQVRRRERTELLRLRLRLWQRPAQLRHRNTVEGRRQHAAGGPHRTVPERVADQPGGVGEQALTLRVRLLRGDCSQFLGEPADQGLRSGPLADHAPGGWRGLVHIPESRITAGRRLPEVDIAGVQRVEGGGHVGGLEAGPLGDVGNRDHEAVLKEVDCRVQHWQIPA